MIRVLVVSGARALAQVREGSLGPPPPSASMLWAKGILRSAFDWWRPDVLVHGGCVACPDEWSSDISRSRAGTERIFTLDGKVIQHGYVPRGLQEFDLRWAEYAVLAGESRFRVPLLRNGAMISSVAARCTDGVETLFVGLGAPWATTHGTEHTTNLARETKKMRVEYRPCPAEFAP